MNPYPRVLSEKIKLYLRRTLAARLVYVTSSGIFDLRDHAVKKKIIHEAAV
jgi:hypothetical protein